MSDGKVSKRCVDFFRDDESGEKKVKSHTEATKGKNEKFQVLPVPLPGKSQTGRSLENKRLKFEMRHVRNTFTRFEKLQIQNTCP